MRRSSALQTTPPRAGYSRGLDLREKKKAKRRQTKFSRIVETIAKRIQSGKLKEGDRLPSEEQFAKDFVVSLGTAQKALVELVHQGLITRQHGRGTFVSRRRRSPAELQYLKFKDQSGEDIPLYVHLHRMRTIRQQGPWSDFLGSAHSFIRIQRVISVGGQFEVFSEFVLREDEFDAVSDFKLMGLEQSSLRDTFRQQFALPTLRVEQRVRVDLLPAEIAKLLKLPSTTQGLVMEVLGYTTNDRPFCYQRVYSGPFSASLIVSH